MDARRMDADSSGARNGVARLSDRSLRGVELRLSKDALWSPVPGAKWLSSMRQGASLAVLAGIQRFWRGLGPLAVKEYHVRLRLGAVMDRWQTVSA